MALDNTRMKEIDLIYAEAFTHAVSSLEMETRKAVLLSWRKIVSTEKAYLLVTEGGSERIRNNIFSDSILTDFVLQFTYVFMSMWSAEPEEVKSFIQKIAVNLSQTMGGPNKTVDENYAATPKDITGRMSTQEDIISLLSNNTWLLLIVVSSIFMTFTQVDILARGAGAKE